MKSDYDFSDIARELRNRNELVAYEVEATEKIAKQLRGLRQLLQSREQEMVPGFGSLGLIVPHPLRYAKSQRCNVRLLLAISF